MRGMGKQGSEGSLGFTRERSGKEAEEIHLTGRVGERG